MDIVEETLAMYWNQHRGLPYKEVLEYITSTDDSYFELEANISSNLRTELEFGITNNFVFNNGCLLGSYENSQSSKFLTYQFAFPSNTQIRLPSGNSFANENLGTTLTAGNRYNISYKSGDINFNGSQVSTAVGSFQDASNKLRIFGRCSSLVDQNSVKQGVMLYCLKIYDDGTMIYDLLPVLDFQLKPCLYDRIHKKFFYNLGTTEPTYKRWDKIELEYLESSGTQYFDSGLRATNKSKVEADIMLTDTGENTNRIFGNYNSFTTAYTLNCASDYNTSRFGSQLQQKVPQLQLQLGTRYIVGNSQNGLALDGTIINTWDTESFITPGNVALLASTNSASTVPNDIANGIYGRCYGITWKENNILVRDFIPTRDRNGVNCMYDACYNKMYYNAGTGDFTGKVKLPDGYEAVQYLESTGTQYIDTLRVPNNDDIIAQKFQKLGLEGATCSWYGSMPSSSSPVPRIAIGSYSPTQYVSKIFAGVNNTIQVCDTDTAIHTIQFQAIDANSMKCILDGITSIAQGQQQTLQPKITLTSYLFARHGNKGVQVHDNEGTRIYYHKEYLADGSPVRHFIPCVRKSDGKPGLYDLCHSICPLTGTSFYVNAGAGEFIVPSQSQP